MHTHTNLIDVSPVLSMVVESLPQHTHDQPVSLGVVRVLGQLSHQGTAGAPGVIGGRLTNFGLGIRVVVHDVLSVLCVCEWE